MKDLMVLEAKLKTAQEEALKADSEKHNLQRELQELRQAQDQLLSKIKESQEFIEVCTQFMHKNGLMVNASFVSESSDLDLFG